MSDETIQNDGEKPSPPPKNKDVLKELVARVELLTKELALSEGAHWTVQGQRNEGVAIIATCAVHAISILAEIATYQRVLAETSAITLQMKQMGAQRGMGLGPGGVILPRG